MSSLVKDEVTGKIDYSSMVYTLFIMVIALKSRVHKSICGREVNEVIKIGRGDKQESTRLSGEVSKVRLVQKIMKQKCIIL